MLFRSDYRAVAYLESTGTQWINTGVKLSNKSEARVTLYAEDSDTRKTQTPYGWSGDASKQFYCFSQYYNESTQTNSSIFYLPKNFVTSKQRVIGKCDIIHNAEGFTVNGIKTSRTTEFDPFETPGSCHVFSASQGSKFLGRIYSFSISRNGQLQRNLIPCIDNLGNPCMYDTVTKEAFRNEGSDIFLTPESITTYSLRQPVPAYARMTAHGVQKLYHLPEGYEGSEDEYAQENGFKLLTENERPEEGSWRPEWVETDNELILNWIEVEEEEELTNV